MIVILILIVASIVKILDFIYVFQIKEYRFDRLRSYLNDVGIVHALYNPSIRMPAKSLRNALLFLIANCMGAALFVLSAPLWGLVYSILIVLLVPVTAFLLVSFAVYLTEPFAQLKRNSIITRAKLKVAKSKAVFIGVSGTYGKSTTKEFLYQILSTKYKTAKTDKNMNSAVGVALSILKNLKDDTQYFVAEVGAYKRMEVYDACTIFRPTYAVITAFGNQHIDLFGSHENLVRSESEILEFLPTNGTAYINRDILEFERITTGARYGVVSYSATHAGATIHLTHATHSSTHQTATVQYNKKSFQIKTGLIGVHIMQNLLPCIAFALDRGLSTGEIQKAISQLEPIIGKLSMHTGPNASSVLHDASNSSIEGFISAIKTTTLYGHQYKYIVSKGIIELGKEKKQSYKRVLDVLVNTGIILVTTDPVFAQLHTLKDQIVTLKSEQAIIIYLLQRLNKSSLLVLEGKFTKPFINTFIAP